MKLRRIGENDFAAMSGNRLAGRIMAKPKAFGESVFFWTVTGVYVPAPMQPSHGEAQSLDAAKASFKTKWQALLDLAEKEGKPVQWVEELPMARQAHNVSEE